MNNSGPAPQGNRKDGVIVRILIADDLLSHRDLMRFTLESCGYEVMEAEDGEQVVAFAAEFSPHVFILDLLMPKMNGYEAAMALRAIPAFEKTPIIALTATTSYERSAEFATINFCDYLVKPVGPARLRLCVSALV
jgi:CheY-like chemotaxis protein